MLLGYTSEDLLVYKLEIKKLVINRKRKNN